MEARDGLIYPTLLNSDIEPNMHWRTTRCWQDFGHKKPLWSPHMEDVPPVGNYNLYPKDHNHQLSRDNPELPFPISRSLPFHYQDTAWHNERKDKTAEKTADDTTYIGPQSVSLLCRFIKAALLFQSSKPWKVIDSCTLYKFSLTM